MFRHSIVYRSDPPFRVFGSPVALQTQQSTRYLRHLNLSFVAHTSNIYATLLASYWYGAKNCFCTLPPPPRGGGRHVKEPTLISFFDLVDYCERAGLASRAAKDGGLLPLDSVTHPGLRCASCLIEAYAAWWLMLVAGYYRWVDSRKSSMAIAHANYFTVSNTQLFSFGMGESMRRKMTRNLEAYGIHTASAPLIKQHFERLVVALDDHFASHDYILGTPGPTLADICLAASLNGQLVFDEASRSEIVDEERHNLIDWCVRMDSVGVLGGPQEAAARLNLPWQPAAASAGDGAAVTNTQPPLAASFVRKGKRRRVKQEHSKLTPLSARLPTGAFQDLLPASLEPVLDLIYEVWPWIVAQCDTLKAWYAAADAPVSVVEIPSHDGVQGPIRTVAHEVPRLLEQEWLMNIGDGVALECDVSVFHVSIAQRMARIAAATDLSGRMTRARDVNDTPPWALPDAASESIRTMLMRCEMGLHIAHAKINGTEGTFAVWRAE